MNQERWERIKELFHAASELPEEEREAYLRRECGGDEELYREVEGMLHDPGSFLVAPDVRGRSEAGWKDRPERVGDFELLEELGRGGMGVVFKARQAGLDRIVALKVLPPYLTRKKSDLERFEREARAVARLKHPGIVAIHSVGQEGETPWFAMELVEGRSLFEELELLRRGPRPGGPRPILPGSDSREFVPAAARLCAEVADAIQCAHEAGVVHRDIKPRNLLLDEAGHPHVVDFGLARIADLAQISRTGDLLGTLHYMSPEQARILSTEVDHRTDVYSIGVVLYELLTKKRPHDGTTSQEILHKIEREEPLPVRERNPNVPHDLAVICHGALAKHPEERYATAGELAADLWSFLGHRAIARRAPTVLQRARSWTRAHARWVGAAALVVVAGVGGAWGRQVVAQRESDRGLLEELRAAVERFEEMPPGEVPELLRRGRECVAEGRLGAEGAGLVERLNELRQESCEQMGGLFERALESAMITAPRTDYSSARFRARPELVEAIRGAVASSLYQGELDAETVMKAAELSMVSVSVRVLPDSMASTAQVWVQRFDPVNGRLETPELLGPPSTEPDLLPPDHYKFVVVVPGIGFAELYRSLESRGESVVLDAWIRPWEPADDPIPQGMVRVPSSAFRLVLPARTTPEIDYEVRSFLIDERFVSNGEYRRFLEEAGGTEPGYWRQAGGRPTDWDDRPVVEIPIEEARRYAEWAGKRLPTLVEWQLAARGPERRRYPWGDERDERLELFNIGGPSEHDDRYQSLPEGTRKLAWYVENVRAPADLPADCRGVNGMEELLGNVWEWTESLSFVIGPDDQVQLVPGHYRRAGHSCATPTWFVEDRGLEGTTDARGAFALTDTGFRCAKSVEPLP